MNAIPPVSAIALSGMQAAQVRLAASAHNVANSSTEGFRRLEATQTADRAGGVAVELSRSAVPGAQTIADAVDQLSARQDFMANLAVFKSNDRMLGQLLDAKA